MNRPIGIDLGTTHSLAAVRLGPRIQIVPNAEGQLLTPSVVAFPARGDPLVGGAAVEWARRDPESAVFSVKRRIGSGEAVRVHRRETSALEVSALILEKVALDAGRALGWPVRDVVVTVPAYFNARQRGETLDAAERAGLRVLRILNEPTAAALAYGLGDEAPQVLAVWDLGGGTFDVSILHMGRGVCEVVAVDGDNFLGGDDWDLLVAAHLREAIRAGGGGGLPDNPMTAYRLLQSARAARCDLSDAVEVEVDLADLHADLQGCGQAFRLSRTALSRLAAPLLERMQAPTRRALEQAGMTVADVDRVILAGGATRMPTVRRLAEHFFGKPVTRFGNPDHVVAMGAAVQASALAGDERRTTLVDVVPHTLGVVVTGGGVAPLIARNTALPARAERIFTTAGDDQTSAHIHVVQGESPRAVDNVTLGRFDLNGLTGLPRGRGRIEVVFELDASGILHAHALDLHGESLRRVEIVPVREGAAARKEGSDHEARENRSGRLQAV